MTRLLPLCLVGIATAVSAQPPAFRAAIEVVELDVSVTRNGRPVIGLTSRDFVVTDNGATQQVDTVTLERLPLNVTLALDVSQSMSGGRLDHLVRAGEDLTRVLSVDDHAALVTFSHAIRLRVPLTRDMDRIRTELRRLTAFGATALRDALHLSIASAQSTGPRSLILLFTDGRDTASWLSEQDVLDSIRRSGTVIHIVRARYDTSLNRLADASGGRVWAAGADHELRAVFTQALEEMRARYLLTYSPPEPGKPGWHEVKVSLRNGGGEIKARPGYVVGEGPSR